MVGQETAHNWAAKQLSLLICGTSAEVAIPKVSDPGEDVIVVRQAGIDSRGHNVCLQGQ